MKSPKDTTVAGPGGGGKRRDADEDKRDRKKKGNGNDDARLLVKNNFPHSGICMLTNETWAVYFAGKQLNQRPQWIEWKKSASAALVVPSRNTVFPTVPTRRVTYQP